MAWWWLALAVASAEPSILDRYSSPAPLPTEEDPFVWQVSPLTVAAGSMANVTLRLVVPPGDTVYRDQIDVVGHADAGLVVGAADLPPGRFHADPANGSDGRELYDMDVVVLVPVTVPRATAAGLVPLTLDLRHQGCRPGLCFPPHEEHMQLWVHVTAPANPR